MYKKSDANKKIIFVDATNLYGHSISQVLLYDGIEMWQDHPDLYKDKLEDFSITPDDSGFGYFIEDEISCPYERRQNQDMFHFVLNIRI